MRSTLIFCLLLLFQNLFSQEEAIDRSILSIMVVPYTNPGEGVRSLIENNELCRTTIGQINQVFEARNYRIKDYMALIKQEKFAPEFATLDRSEIREAIKNAIVDVVIYAEIKVQAYAEGDSQVRLKLQAIDHYSAENYANNVSIESTRRFYKDMTMAVTEKQLVNQLNGFADQLDKKFANILEHGRTVTIKVSVHPESKFNLSSALEDSHIDLGGTIAQWLNSRVLNMNNTNSSAEYWQAECSLPVRDANLKTITPYSFRTEFKAYLLQLRISSQPVLVEDVTTNAVIEMAIR